MKVTPPGDLSADRPNYPGRNVDWKITGYYKKTRYIQLTLPISVNNRTKKKQTAIPIGKSQGGETDEQTFRRAWDILNYIKSLVSWNTMTKDEICISIMSADERYHLKGANAQKYGPNGYIMQCAVGGRLNIVRLNEEATTELDSQRRNRGPSAQAHLRAVVDVSPQQQQHLEDGDVPVDGNVIIRIIRFFTDRFGGAIAAMENEAINVNGTADSFENLASQMLPALGGPTRGLVFKMSS